MTTSPTLDPHRTDQLRTFLVTEAAADAATAPSTGRRWAPRLAVGVAAALLLGDTLAVARQSYVHPEALRVGASAPVRDAVGSAARRAGSDEVRAILHDEELRLAVYRGLLP